MLKWKIIEKQRITACLQFAIPNVFTAPKIKTLQHPDWWSRSKVSIKCKEINRIIISFELFGEQITKSVNQWFFFLNSKLSQSWITKWKSDMRMQNYVRADIVRKAERKTKTGWTFKNKYDKLYFIKNINDPFVILSPTQQGLRIFIWHTETIMTEDIHSFYHLVLI